MRFGLASGMTAVLSMMFASSAQAQTNNETTAPHQLQLTFASVSGMVLPTCNFNFFQLMSGSRQIANFSTPVESPRDTVFDLQPGTTYQFLAYNLDESDKCSLHWKLAVDGTSFSESVGSYLHYQLVEFTLPDETLGGVIKRPLVTDDAKQRLNTASGVLSVTGGTNMKVEMSEYCSVDGKCIKDNTQSEGIYVYNATVPLGRYSMTLYRDVAVSRGALQFTWNGAQVFSYDHSAWKYGVQFLVEVSINRYNNQMQFDVSGAQLIDVAQPAATQQFYSPAFIFAVVLAVLAGSMFIGGVIYYIHFRKGMKNGMSGTQSEMKRILSNMSDKL